MKKVLFLVRGLPGSGKTTVAELLAGVNSTDMAKYPVMSADMFFEKNGEYKFNAAQLGLAHKWCQDEVERAMQHELDRIFVANTFTMEREINPYIKLAEQYGYSVVSMIIENRHGNSNIHGVPEESLKKMEERFVVKLI